MTFITLCVLVVFVFCFSNTVANAGEDPAEDLQIKASRASSAGQFEKASQIFTQELDLLIAKGRHLDAAAVYTQFGEMSQIEGQFPAAEASYKNALDLFQHYAKPNDLSFIAALDDLGWMYVTWGRQIEGARLLNEAHHKAERVPPKDPGLLRHLDTQAAYLSVEGRYSEAVSDWKRALAIGAAAYGPDSRDYDSLLVHFGQASDLFGDYAGAVSLFRKYLNIESPASAGPANLSYAVAAGELAHVYTELHKYPEARHWFSESMNVFGSHPGEPLVYSMILSYLGDAYMAQRDWANAELQYRKALNIEQSVLGNNHTVAWEMFSLAKALRKRHAKSEAKDLESRAKAILIAEKNPTQEATIDVLALRHEEHE